MTIHNDHFDRMFNAIHDRECEMLPVTIYNELLTDIFTSGMKQDYVSTLHIYYSAPIHKQGTISKNIGMYFELLNTYYYNIVQLQLAVYKFNTSMDNDWAQVKILTDRVCDTYNDMNADTWKPEPAVDMLMKIVAQQYQYECAHANGEYEFAEQFYIKR
jgi:hypothetical protein